MKEREQVENVVFSPLPRVKVRVIEYGDSSELKEHKKKYPFELINPLLVVVITDRRTLKFTIHKGFIWNGADIPRFLWRLIGSRTDNDFLLASMVHDYMLDYRHKILKEDLNEDIELNEYRRLTSLIFREVIKQQGTGVIKSNIMSFAVDCFQKLQKGWKK